MSPQRSGSAPLDPPALLGARLPAVLRRLRTVLAGDPFDATRVEELVALDPVLAAQVLHHCTDPPAGRQPAPLSLREAIRRLGANSLHQICRVRVPSPRSWNWESGRHRIAWLYEHSVVTASFGRLLASELAPGHEEDAHLAGLVHDLGMFALLERFGSRYVRFLETNSKSEARLTELERRELGDSHEEVGVELVRAWKLPSSLYSVVGGHHGPGRMERRGSLVEIVGLAERLTRAAGLAGPLSQDGGPEELDRLMTELELPPRLRRRAPVMLEEAMARIASVHDATSSAPGALARTLSESRVTPPEIRSPALSKTARLLRDGDRIHTEAELGLWLRKVVLQETAFERAMVFLADERQETLREVLDEREATLRRPLGLSVDELFAPGSADQSHCVMRLRPGSPRRPDLLERLSNHEVTLALMSGEGRFPAIGVMVCDRPFSRLPVRRRDLWFLEILCRAIGQKIERRRLLARVDSYRHDAERDYLTGLYNRRYTMQQLEQKQAECRETGSALSLVLLDLDNFKAFNDTYGHLAGDTVLREIGQLLLETARACDVAGRYGGEEFLIVLPNTSVEHAFVFSERLRNVVEEYGRHQLGRFPDQPPTISIGVGSVSFDDTPESAIDRVDKALYASKQTGRNRVCLGLTDEERYVWLGQTETNGP